MVVFGSCHRRRFAYGLWNSWGFETSIMDNGWTHDVCKYIINNMISWLWVKFQSLLTESIQMCLLCSYDMSLEKRAKIPTCNAHNPIITWLVASHEAILDDLIEHSCKLQNYMSWLKGVAIDKGPNSTLLKIKDVTMCRNPRMLTNAMKFFHGRKRKLTRDCALEGLWIAWVH